MGVRRFKVEPPLAPGSATIAGDEARHLRVVLRARPGERVALFDGCGRGADAEIVEAGRDAVTCRVIGEVRQHPEPPCRVELCCALPRAGAADDVVRVAVEVGARAIRPLVTERGVWRPDEPGESRRAERFTRAAVAALKQSGLAWMPEILPAAEPESLRFLGDELALAGSVGEGASPLVPVLAARRPIARAVVIVGPEGGFSEREEAALAQKGALLVRAGLGTLRVETAVVVLISHVLSHAE